MLGRALFAFVWLIIAAGLLLPLFPAEVAAPGLADARIAATLAEAVDPGCERCAVADADAGACRSGRWLRTAPAAAEACLRLRLRLVVEPVPPDRPPETVGPLSMLPTI
jgi:hypothetical protein